MTQLLDPVTELDRLAGHSSAPFVEAMLPLMRLHMKDGGEHHGWDEPYKRKLTDLADVFGETLALSDLMGRRRVLLELDAHKAGAQPATFAADNPVMPHVTFPQAIKDLVSREPRLAGTAAAVAKLYRDRHAIAFAYAADLELTKRVQEYLATTMRRGTERDKATGAIAEMTDWTRAYADTVYRTNLNTAYTAGRFREMAQPEVRDYMPAFHRSSAGDVDVRPMHRLADGLIAAVDDPVWHYASTPGGYNCRCMLVAVSVFELERLGLRAPDGKVIPRYPSGFASFVPDPGFGTTRPDVRFYQ